MEPDTPRPTVQLEEDDVPVHDGIGAGLTVVLMVFSAMVAAVLFAPEPVHTGYRPDTRIGLHQPQLIGPVRRTLFDQEWPATEMKQDEAKRALERYEWVDRAHGVARIPIERAMAIVARTGGWPSAAAPAPAVGNRSQPGRRRP